jgi:hypothetical protein
VAYVELVAVADLDKLRRTATETFFNHRRTSDMYSVYAFYTHLISVAVLRSLISAMPCFTADHILFMF